MDVDYYIKAALINDNNLSRSLSSGIINRDISNGKPIPSTNDAEKIKEIITYNTINIVKFLYQHKDENFNSKKVFSLIREMVSLMNNGLYDQKLFLRTHEIPADKCYGLNVNILENEMDIFCNWYTMQLDLSNTNPYISCALTEKIFDKVHFLADASGRISRLLSIFISMRFDNKIRLHENSKKMYEKMGRVESGIKKYEINESKEFLNYYLSLPFCP